MSADSGVLDAADASADAPAPTPDGAIPDSHATPDATADSTIADAQTGSDGFASSGAYRAFSNSSWWNTPMPASAPRDPNSDLYIADAKDTSVSIGYLRLSGAPGHSEAYAYPIYWATSTDPKYTIVPSRYGPTVDMRIPLGATPQSGSDGALIVYDLAANRVFELWKASYDAGANRWSASSTKRYVLDSNGLSHRVAGSDSSLNDGHRGIGSPIRAIRLDEVKSGAIRHRLECFWHATGRPNDATAWYYWPMSGYESGKGGVTPEGIVLRIKPSVDLSSRKLSPAALVIARALQQYGCIIGDNDGGSGNSLKLERGMASWAALDPNLDSKALSALSWDDYEFIRGGFQP